MSQILNRLKFIIPEADAIVFNEKDQYTLDSEKINQSAELFAEINQLMICFTDGNVDHTLILSPEGIRLIIDLWSVVYAVHITNSWNRGAVRSIANDLLVNLAKMIKKIECYVSKSNKIKTNLICRGLVKNKEWSPSTYEEEHSVIRSLARYIPREIEDNADGCGYIY